MFSGPPPAWSTVLTSTSSSAVTPESLLAVMKQMEALPKPEFDCLVCDNWGYSTLYKEFGQDWYRGLPDHLFSIPIYCCLSREEAEQKAQDLHKQGKRPRLLTKGEY